MLKVSNLTGFGAGVVGTPTADALLLESGDSLLLEDGFKILLDNSGDDFFSSVVLLLPFDEVDGSTTTDDKSNSNHTFTFESGAEIDSAQGKFVNSLSLDGTANGQIHTPDSDDFNFADGPFTVEAYIRFLSGATKTGDVITQYSLTGNNQRSWSFLFGAGPILKFTYSFNGITPILLDSPTITVNSDTWYHVAATRDDDDELRSFFHGTIVANTNLGSNSLHNSTGTLRIGNRHSGGSVFAPSGGGWIDDVRITKGVARYVSGFDPPGAHRHPNE